MPGLHAGSSPSSCPGPSLSEGQLQPAGFSLFSLDESDYQTEYEEEILDNQKDDYINFISNQVEEDSDSVRTALETGSACVITGSGVSGVRWRCQEAC